MTPEQTRILGESFEKLRGRLPELAAAVYAKLFEISPESRRLFPNDMEAQNAKLAKVFAELVRVKTRSKHFLPVTKSGGEAVIPGVGQLGERHKESRGVEARHYGYMRTALLHAIEKLLGKDFNERVAAAWGEAFDMLSEAMVKHSGGTPEVEAFERIFSGKSAGVTGAEEFSDRFFNAEVGQAERERSLSKN
jgi:hemoglobin-like flavoprotein